MYGGKRLKLKNIIIMVKHGGDSIILLGCFFLERRQENRWRHEEEGLSRNSEAKPFRLLKLGFKWEFQPDSNPNHTPKGQNSSKV